MWHKFYSPSKAVYVYQTHNVYVYTAKSLEIMRVVLPLVRLSKKQVALRYFKGFSVAWASQLEQL